MTSRGLHLASISDRLHGAIETTLLGEIVVARAILKQSKIIGRKGTSMGRGKENNDGISYQMDY
jgi:hypothetical protein